jgi:hypothetical protein
MSSSSSSNDVGKSEEEKQDCETRVKSDGQIESADVVQDGKTTKGDTSTEKKKTKKKKKQRFTLDKATLDSISTSSDDLYDFLQQIYREEDEIGTNSDPARLALLKSLRYPAQDRWLEIVFPGKLVPPWWGIVPDKGRYFPVVKEEESADESEEEDE